MLVKQYTYFRWVCDMVHCVNTDNGVDRLDAAVSTGKLSQSAAENIRQWLTAPRYAAYAEQVSQLIHDQSWQLLDDVFWTVIPFGTGGRRGRMYPVGSNAINERTMGESAQGLAEYVTAQLKNAGSTDSPSCAIAYDTRHHSEEFAKLCAEIMVANGFTVYFLDEYRSTPELSFLVRRNNCDCGIMITASHNPPCDNAIKAYWSTGGQLLPPHDQGVIDQVMNVDAIARSDFDQAVTDGKIIYCKEDIDHQFVSEVLKCSFGGPRDLKVIYSPLHGVGATAVCPVLRAAEFRDVEVFGLHANPDGDFPNVPGHVSNPENPAVFDAMIEQAQKVGADLIMATDPDCDRLGCAAPLTSDRSGPWGTLNGNQIAALLTDYVLEQRRKMGQLSDQHYVVKTLVTTDMVRRIADSYNVKTEGNLLVGFKWIGGKMDECGPELFAFGAEESHGYLVGQYARDKDAAVASLLLAELAANLKAENLTLHDKLQSLFRTHGYHRERMQPKTMSGSEGMDRMKSMMAQFRSAPPKTLGGMSVLQIRDYQNGQIVKPNGSTSALAGPTGDMVIIDLNQPGNCVAVRPSGTEPKVKFYTFAYVPSENIRDLDSTIRETEAFIDQLIDDLTAYAENV